MTFFQSGNVWGDYCNQIGSLFAGSKDPFQFLASAGCAILAAPTAVGEAICDSFINEPEVAVSRTVGFVVTACTGSTAAPFVLASAETCGQAALHERQKQEDKKQWAKENKAEAERLERISTSSDMDDFFS